MDGDQWGERRGDDREANDKKKQVVITSKVPLDKEMIVHKRPCTLPGNVISYQQGDEPCKLPC